MSTTISGDTGVDKVQSGAVISDTSIKGALNATGTAPIYACRAWVNFNGTGTVAIRASGNVSSITDNEVGNYTVNFTTAMPDVNYAMASSGDGNVAGNSHVVEIGPIAEKLTTSLKVYTVGSTGLADFTIATLAIFR